MATERELLDGVNKSELIQLARDSGLGTLGRALSEDELIEILLFVDAENAPKCPLEGKRVKMERHIDKNRKRLLSQLPGCDGRCTTFGCPDLVVVRCWEGFRHDIL